VPRENCFLPGPYLYIQPEAFHDPDSDCDMNTDIRISVALLTNKKIKRLIRRKGHTGLFNLLSLWIYAGIHAPNGTFVGMDKEDLMDAASSTDETLIGMLEELTLLDFDGERYSIHDWVEHNHWATGAEKRSEKARKAADARWSMEDKNA